MSITETARPPNPRDRGDYPGRARRLEPAASALAEAVGHGHRRRAIDVAGGDGSLAAALHRSGRTTSATDGAATMVDRGRTAAAGVLLGDRSGEMMDAVEAHLAGYAAQDGSIDLRVQAGSVRPPRQTHRRP